MSSNNAKTDKKKIAVNEQTYEKLKTFTRFNGLKMRMTIDTLVDVVLQDEELSKRIIDLTLARDSEDKE
jgi:hypothetical protein